MHHAAAAMNPPRAISGRTWWPGLLLFVICFAVFAPTLPYAFLNVDDNIYVSENQRVLEGLTWANLVWAFTSIHEAYWIPLTWVSYMIDSTVFGHEPWGYRLTNLVLHAGNTVWVWLLLGRLTGCWKRSWVVALLFAVHPMRLESVVWITERKDVLSGFFGLAAIAFYVGYVQVRRAWMLAAVVIAMVVSMMTKPMLVTLPGVLLLLDAWPLGRFRDRATRGAAIRNAVVEKWPLIGLSTGFSGLTLWTQHAAGAMRTGDGMGWLERMLGVPVHVGHYLVQTVWPVHLSIYYPPAQAYEVSVSMAWLTGLVAMTLGAAVVVKRCPAVLVGWLWFLGVLVPVIGIVRVGSVVVADRFVYLPHIGLFWAAVWGVSELISRKRFRLVGPILAAGIAASLIGLNLNQQPRWRSTESVMRQALAVGGPSEFVLNNLGVALNMERRFAEARDVFTEALALVPHSATLMNNKGLALLSLREAQAARDYFLKALKIGDNEFVYRLNLGRAATQLGQYDEAVAMLNRALELQPNSAEGFFYLGLALAGKQQGEEAEVWFKKAKALNPRMAEMYVAHGVLLLDRGRVDEALNEYRQALLLEPDNPDARVAAAQVHAQRGEMDAAMDHYRHLLSVQPDHLASLNNLAWILATDERFDAAAAGQAVALARRAAELTRYNNPNVLDSLAAAYAAAGRFAEAVAVADQALALAFQAGREDLADSIARRKDGYRQLRPYRVSPE